CRGASWVLTVGTSAARATTTRATSASVRRVIVMPGPSSSGARRAAAGREAAAGPREREAFGAPARPVPAPGREVVRAPERLPPDAGTGRLVVRGAPGRLLLMRRGYNLVPGCSGSEPREGGAACVACGLTQLLLDAEQLVVLRHALAARRGAGLDLAAVGGHRQVGDGGVLGLTGAVGHHRGEARAVREVHGVQGLGERADLVDLDQQGVRAALRDAAAETLGVGDEQVVPDQLGLRAEAVGDGLPALPVLLVQRVLDGDQRVRVDELGVVPDHLGGGLLCPLEGVGAVGEELRGGDVEREGDVLAGLEAGPADGLDDEVE